MTQCPICSAPARQWMTVPGDWRRPSLPQSYDLRWCDACAHGFVHPMPSLSESIAAHDVDDYFTHHDETRSTPGSKLRQVDHRLRSHLAWRLDRGGSTPSNFTNALRGCRRVVELGCGKGELGCLLQERGFDYVGVEIDATARAIAHSRGLDIVEGVLQEVPDALNGREFDAVVAVHVLEHVSDVQAAMKTISTLTRPGGKVVVEVPNNGALGAARSEASWYWLDVPRHVHFFTHASLSRLFRDSGLEIDDIRFTGFTRQFKEDWISAEQHIYDVLAKKGWRGARPGRWRSWRLLTALLRKRDPERYDSVMLTAHAPH